MLNKLAWSIGKEGTERTCLDSPPYRVFIYWLEDGKIQKALDLDRAGLVHYIKNAACLSDHENQQLQLALIALDNAAGMAS